MRRSVSTKDSQAHAKCLEQLEAAFMEFRRTHEPGRRIPAALRAQVVRALDEGVAERRLRLACRVSWNQLRRWRSTQSTRRAPVPTPRARVLSVVDPDPRELAHTDGNIEIKVGPWRMCLSRSIG